MKFLNLTKNTIYLADIDLYLPFEENSYDYIDSEQIKKSKAFQLLVKMGKIGVIEIDGSRIERNLKRAHDDYIIQEGLNVVQSGNTEPSVALGKPGMNVKIKGHFEDAGGYAKVNRNAAFGLYALGVNVFIETVGNANDLTEIEAVKLNRFKKPPPRKCINIDSIVPSFSNLSTGIYNILYTTIESYTIPKQFVEAVKAYNEIWVVSDFCKEVLEKYDVKQKIFVMPDGIDLNLYKEDGEKYHFRPELNPFVFLSVFGWSYRKGYDVLLKGYLREFCGDDPVSLLIMSRFHNNAKQDKVVKDGVQEFIDKHGGDNPAHIARCSQVVPEGLMPSLYRACNAYVCFSRGEGFGYTMTEGSLCGLPVLSTNATGQTMFLKHDNSYLLEPDKIEKMPPGLMHVHYWDNQHMLILTADKTIGEAGALMRKVFENCKIAKQKNKKLQSFIKENYDMRVTSKKIYDRLSEIWEKLK
tara:strand:- start:2834 stop:4240 length:1407 start_codon:yes stop_codon:yes gene_type:complete